MGSHSSIGSSGTARDPLLAEYRDTEAGRAGAAPHQQSSMSNLPISVSQPKQVADTGIEAWVAGTAQWIPLTVKASAILGGSIPAIAISATATAALMAYVSWGVQAQQNQYRYVEGDRQPSRLPVAIAQQLSLVTETAAALIAMDAGMMISGGLGVATLFRMAKRWYIDSNREFPSELITNGVMKALAPIFPIGEAAIMHAIVPLFGAHTLAKHIYGLFHSRFQLTSSIPVMGVTAVLAINSLMGMVVERDLQFNYDIWKGLEKAAVTASSVVKCLDSCNTSMFNAGSHKLNSVAKFFKASSQAQLGGVSAAAIGMVFCQGLKTLFDVTVSRDVQLVTMGVLGLGGAIAGVFAGLGQLESRLPSVQAKLEGTAGSGAQPVHTSASDYHLGIDGEVVTV